MGTSTVIALGVVAAITAAVIAVALNKLSRRNKEKDMPAGLQVFDGNGKLEVDVTSSLLFLHGTLTLNYGETYTYTVQPDVARGRTLFCFCATGAPNAWAPTWTRRVERINNLSIKVNSLSNNSVYVFLLI